MDVSQGGGTQYAQRAWETVMEFRSTAFGFQHFLGGVTVSFERQPDMNCLPAHIKVSFNTVHWSIWIKIISLVNTRTAEANLTSRVTVMFADTDSSREILKLLSSRKSVISPSNRFRQCL
ncbi:hypothetical protein DPMN_159531 [Dreissena polymorpha]|uniref:Uncharacterized protein n=1 Tax=Dreissena polymorpha TaxID=45954 RepID=A0A9D4ENF5_DREPO|nr:hypothetical protein DPMN_159531 [Dreissena polymorpha]